MKIFAQKLLVGRTFLANQTVTVEDGQITAIDGGGPADFSVWALTPGLVDLHCHGGQGFDPELNERPLPEFLTILLCHGVTDVLLTLGAEPLPTMRRALAVVQTAMQQQAAGKLPGAHILGVHLEGPFLSPERPGAMPPAALLPPTLAAYQTLVQGYESVIRQVTLAPELPGALELGAALAARGIRVQAGHTDADYETAQRAFSAGFTGLCHTFNACRPLRHRDPGVVAAALLDPNVTTECICDLVHLHPAALQLVYHMKGPEAMIAVSDSVATHGLPDGRYTVAGQDYIVQNGVSRCANGTLDGGGVYLDGAVRNLQSIGIPAQDACLMASTIPGRRPCDHRRPLQLRTQRDDRDAHAPHAARRAPGDGVRRWGGAVFVLCQARDHRTRLLVRGKRGGLPRRDHRGELRHRGGERSDPGHPCGLLCRRQSGPGHPPDYGGGYRPRPLPRHPGGIKTEGLDNSSRPSQSIEKVFSTDC